MRRIVMPVLLLVVALAALFGSNQLSDQLHDDLGEVAADDTVPPGVGTPLVSTRRLTSMLAPSLTEPDFFDALDELMASSPVSACLHVTQNGSSFDPRENGYTNTPVSPSDATLLLTLATAHQTLGPDHTFTTSVQSVVPMEGGVINGDVYLVGGGDPLLLTREFAATLELGQNQLRTPIEELAQGLVDDGLALVTGAVVGDATRYDDLFYGSWPEETIESQNIGTLLALQFDDGWRQFPVSDPELEAEETAAQANEEAVGYVVADDPPWYAAALFDDMLEARDVVIRRTPRSEGVPEGEELYILASIESAPLSAYYRQILDNRDIETIEMLIKEIGLVTTGVGSTQAGLQAMNNTLARVGINSDQFQPLKFDDGSGLDPDNVATCPVFTALLDSDEYTPLFRELLPTAAEAGPLQSRFTSVENPGRIRALSGGTSGTSVMMGYIDIGRGQELTFAFIANQQGPPDNQALKELEGRVVGHLASLEAKPTLDDIQLAPLRLG